MSVVFQSDDERITTEYFDSINDLIGMVALGLGYTALQFEHPIPFAVIALIPALLWLSSKGEAYRRIANHYLPKGTSIWIYIRLAWRIKVCLFGVAFLLGVAAGIIDKPWLYKLFGYGAQIC